MAHESTASATLLRRHNHSPSTWTDSVPATNASVVSSKARRRRGLLLISIFAVLAGLFFTASTHDVSVPSLSSFNMHPFSSSSLSAVYDRCNPFAARGYIRNNKDVDNVLWIPFGDACEPSNLLTPEFRKNGIAPWLGEHNHTIVVIGDSIDRFHVFDTCELFNTPIIHITQKHPASPSNYYTPGADEAQLKKEKEQGDRDFKDTRPFLCRIKIACSLDEMGTCKTENGQNTYLNIINFFTFGLDDLGSLFDEEKHFHPPSSYSARLHHFALPTLANLAELYQESSFAAPTVVEACSAMWDLHRWSSEDFYASGQKNPMAGVPATFSSILTDLTPERLDKQAHSTREVIFDLVRSFDAAAAATIGAAPPSMLWRTMSFTKAPVWWVPWARSFQLDALTRHTIDGLREESSLDPKSEAGSLHLHHRLRLDNWGRLIEGQGDKFRDATHPMSNPASVIWLHNMLWELRRAIELGNGAALKK